MKKPNIDLSAWFSAAKSFIVSWNFVITVGYIVFLISMIYFLTTIPSDAAQTEVDTYRSVSSIESISENPLNLPYKAVTYVTTTLSDSVRALRAVGIILLGISTFALYRIVRTWHSSKVALFTSALFITNASVLAVARLASPLVLMLSWTLIISLLLWVRHGNYPKLAPYTLAFLSAFIIYIPGAPYFFLLLAILFIKNITELFKNANLRTWILSILTVLVVLSPLIISSINDIEVLKQWLLLPSNLDLTTIPRNILRVPSAFIYRAPIDPLLNVGRLPVLDVAAGAFMLVGLYSYQKNVNLERTRIMLATALFSILLGALGQVTYAIIILMPFVYFTIAAGIAYIMQLWFGVFPRNPIARSFGIIVMSFVVSASMYYQVTRFLVVWPQTPETRATYNQSVLIQ